MQTDQISLNLPLLWFFRTRSEDESHETDSVIPNIGIGLEVENGGAEPMAAQASTRDTNNNNGRHRLADGYMSLDSATI